MNIETYNNHCLAQEEMTETLSLDEKTLVENVIGNTLTLVNIDIFEKIHLKCDPATAIQLREAYTESLSGYHMHADHCDTVQAAGSIADKQLLGVVDRW